VRWKDLVKESMPPEDFAGGGYPAKHSAWYEEAQKRLTPRQKDFVAMGKYPDKYPVQKEVSLIKS
jgi:hypothetical protein